MNPDNADLVSQAAKLEQQLKHAVGQTRAVELPIALQPSKGEAIRKQIGFAYPVVDDLGQFTYNPGFLPRGGDDS